MGLHLDALLKRRFRAAKCSALLKLTAARIKIVRNQKTVTAQKLRKEIAQLLRSGQDAHAYRLKTDSLIRLQNILRAYDMIEQYCNLVSSRLQIMETQRNCPLDVKEAVTSLIFSAPRCPDLVELPHVREMFAAKYGKEFVMAVGQLRPDCGVNKQIIELLSTRPATGEMRVKLMKEIAAENNIDWKGENEFTKQPADSPGASDKLKRASEQSETDSRQDQARMQSPNISFAESGGRKDHAAIPGGNANLDADIPAIATVSSFGDHSIPAGTIIATADHKVESVEGIVSHLTEFDPPPQASEVETVDASNLTEAAEFQIGVQDAEEVKSVPDSIETAEFQMGVQYASVPDSIEATEFHDAEDVSVQDVEEVCVPDSIDIAEFQMGVQDMEEVCVPDSIDIAEFQMGVQDAEELSVPDSIEVTEFQMGVQDAEEISVPVSIEATEFRMGVQGADEVSVPDSIAATESQIGIQDAEELSVPVSIEVTESQMGVQDAEEVSVPDSIAVTEFQMGVQEAKEVSVSDSMEAMEFQMVAPDSTEAADSIEVAESKNDSQVVGEDESVLASKDESTEGPSADDGTSDKNHEPDCHEDNLPSAGLGSPPLAEMPSLKSNQATTRIPSPQGLYGEGDYSRPVMGRQYKDFASAAQAAFESAALAAEAAQAVIELARFYQQQQGYSTPGTDDLKYSWTPNVQALAAATEIPKVRADNLTKLFKSNVDPNEVAEVQEARPDIERKTKNDSSPAAIFTGPRQTGDPNNGEVTSFGDDDIDRSNSSLDSDHISQECISPGEAGTGHDEFKQKSAKYSEKIAGDDMINPVSLWNRRTAGARLKSEIEDTYVQSPKFDDEEDVLDTYGYGKGFSTPPFAEAKNETVENMYPGWGSGQVAGSSSLSSSAKPIFHKHSPFSEVEEVGGSKLSFETSRVSEDSPAGAKGSGRFAHKPKFDEEVNYGRVNSSATSYRVKAEAPAFAPLPVSDVGLRLEGRKGSGGFFQKPKFDEEVDTEWLASGTSNWEYNRVEVEVPKHVTDVGPRLEVRKGSGRISHEPNNFDEVNDGRLASAATSSRHNLVKAELPAPVSDVEYRSEGKLKWKSSSSNVVDDVHEKRKGGGHVESRRTQRRPVEVVPEEQKEAAAVFAPSWKSEEYEDDEDLKKRVGQSEGDQDLKKRFRQSESWRTQFEVRKPSTALPEEQLEEAATASAMFRKSEGESDEQDLKKRLGQGERRRPQREQRTPSAVLLEDEQEAESFATYRKSAAESNEQDLKKRFGYDESRKAQREHRKPSVALAEDKLVFAPSWKSEESEDDEDLKKRIAQSEGDEDLKKRFGQSESRIEVRKPAIALSEEQEAATTAYAKFRKSDGESDEQELRKRLGQGERRRAQREQRTPSAILLEDEQEATSFATYRKSAAESYEQDLKKMFGYDESRKAQREHRKSPAEDDELNVAALATYRKSETENHEQELKTRVGYGEKQKAQRGHRKPSVVLAEDEQRATAFATYRKSAAESHAEDVKTGVGYGEGRKSEREHSKPTALLADDEQEAAAFATYRKSEAESHEEDLKTGLGYGESRKAQKHRTPSVTLAEEEQDAAALATLKKSEAESHEQDLNKRLGYDESRKAHREHRKPLVARSDEEQEAGTVASANFRKTETELSEKKNGDKRKTPLAQERLPVVPPRQEVAAAASIPLRINESEVLVPDAATEARVSIPVAASDPPSLSRPPSRRPPSPPLPSPQTPLTSSSSDPIKLTTTPPPRPPPSLATATATATSTTSSSPLTPPKLASAVSAPPASTDSPLGVHTHPKLPSYESLAAQFLKLKEEKRAAKPW